MNNELSAKFSVENSFEYLNGEFRFRVIGNASQTEQLNSYLNINEMLYKYKLGQFDIKVGYQIFNWSDLESFHPADIVNARFIDSDIEVIKKKGALAATLNFYSDYGVFKLYVLPRVESNFLPSSNSRVLGGTRPGKSKIVKKDEITNDRTLFQYGGGYELSADDFEIKLNALYHVNTSQVIFGYEQYSVVGTNVVPSGDLASYNFTALDLTASGTLFLDVHTFKFEFLHHSPDDQETQLLTTNGLSSKEDESILALGYEYTYTHATGKESMLFIEYQKALAGDENLNERRSIFQNDVFLGYRLSFNDVLGSELFAGLFYDLSRSEYLYLANFQKRINDYWKYKIGYRGYHIGESDDLGLKILENDDEFYLTLTRYF